MKTLESFARYLREKRLSDLSAYYIDRIKEMDIPLVKLVIEKGLVKDISDKSTHKMTMESLSRFLQSLEDGTMISNTRVSLKNWAEDKIPGIGRNEIQPSDLVLVYAAQKYAILHFLPEFAEDSKSAISITSELEKLYTLSQNEALQILFRIQKETEERLSLSEEKFRLLVQNVKDYAIFMLTPEGHVQSWNEGAERIKGYKADEILGKYISIFYSNEDIKNGLPETNLKLAAENGHLETEGWRVRKNGERFWADITYTAIYNNKGELTGFSKITHDITEQKRVEENRQRLVEMLEATPDFVGFADAKTRNILYINAAGRKMTGIAANEDITSLKIENVHPEWVNKMFAEGVFDKAVRDGIWNGESAFINRKGQEIPVSMVLIAHKNSHGELVRFSTISRDITEQRKSADEIRAVNSFLDSVLENIPNMVFVKEAESLGFVRFNKAGEDLLGVPKSELMGKNDYNFFPKEQADFFTEKDRAVLSQQHIVDIPEEPIATKRGKRWLHTRKIPIFDKTGKPIYLLGISEDITDIRNAKLELERKTQELTRSNTELEQFAYVASHDLQEPLRTVSSYVQLLSNRYKGKLDKDADEFINFAVDGSKRMRQLINSLLEYSRVNRVKPFEWINLNEVINEVKKDMKDQIEETGAVITNEKMPEIYGDTVLIGQLFQNLIGNAIKFHREEKPFVKIGSERKNGEFIFSVQDNGIGIPMQYKEKIFVIFQRLNSRELYPGTGIGLSICKKIVERHGGRIWVESEPAKGTTFFFTIKVT